MSDDWCYKTAAESFLLKILWLIFWCSLVNWQVAKVRLGHLLTQGRMLWVFPVMSCLKKNKQTTKQNQQNKRNQQTYQQQQKNIQMHHLHPVWTPTHDTHPRSVITMKVSLFVEKLHLSLNGILLRIPTAFLNLWLAVGQVGDLLLSASWRLPMQTSVLSIWSAMVYSKSGHL